MIAVRAEMADHDFIQTSDGIMRMAQLRLYRCWSLSATLHDAEYITDVISATVTDKVNLGLIMTLLKNLHTSENFHLQTAHAMD